MAESRRSSDGGLSGRAFDDAFRENTVQQQIRSAIVAVCLLAALPGFSANVAAQITGRLAEKPVVLVRNNGINSRSAIEYAQSVGKELDVGNAAFRMLESQDVQEMLTKHPNPASGLMIYMVQGLIPAAEQITFSEVVDQAEFDRILRAQSARMGPNGTLEGGDGQYKQVISNSWREDITDQPQPAETNNTVTVQVGVGTSSGGISVSNGMSRDAKIIEENGRRYREHSFTYTQYFRFHDGFMFSSSYEDLFTADLPSRETLLGGSETGLDAELQVYPDRIPVGFKHLFWSTISAGAGANLQQRDEEDELDYKVRRSAGDVGLAVLKTVLFDTEMISGSLRLAHDDQPVRGELKLATRDNSNFAKDLGELAKAQSRFAPVLSDDAAATVHLAVKLSDGSRQFLSALGEWIKARLADAAGADIDLAIAGAEIQETLDGVAEHGNLEAMLKLGWSPSSDGVIYGGIQVDDNLQLLRNIYHLATGDDVPRDFADRVSMQTKGDLEMLQIAFPPVPDDFPLKLTHGFLIHAESCLWVCVGSENSWEMLRQSIERCRNATGLRARTPLASVRVDVAQWSAFPADDPVGIGGLPAWGDRALATGMSRPFRARRIDENGTLVETDAEPTVATGLLDRINDSGGSQSAGLELAVDDSGIVLSGHVGSAIGRYFVAQYLQAMDAALRNIPTPDLPEPAATPADTDAP